MKPIKWGFSALLLALTSLWLFADTFLPQPLTYFSFRHVFMQYTGVIAIGVMSVVMLLALRPTWLERPLNGLDKMYRLHKWLGITALVFSVIHWWWATGTKWMVGWGWLERPAQRRQGASLTGVEQWLHGQRELAELLGEWAFYAVVIFLILALVKRFPYHWFKRTHKWIAVPYLMLVYHALVLTRFNYWLEPLGWVMAVLLLGGTAAAVVVFTGRIGRSRRVPGTITSLEYYPGLHTLEAGITLVPGWRGHRPGQFAFVTSNLTEGAHPYTIASAWQPASRHIHFIVKELGDHTRRLKARLKVGMPVSVEGPYGCFDFNDGKKRQIWIGAGIGITPFIARMKELAEDPGPVVVDLFHVSSEVDDTAFDKLRADARAAKVNLYLHLTPRDGRLTPEKIRTAVPDWGTASMWFCGPAAFGSALRKDFLANGLSAGDFHQELFSMR